MTVAGWFPTYAVLTNAYKMDLAAFSGTLFWGMITIFRFATAALKMPCSEKMRILGNSMLLVSGFVLYLNMMGFYPLVAVFGSLGYGFSCSGILALLMSVPIEFGYKLKPHQISNMIVMMNLGPILLTTCVGWLMEDDPINLVYSLVVTSVAVCACVYFLVKFLREGKEEYST